MNTHIFKKSNHVFASACRFSRQSCVQARPFASTTPRLHTLNIESSLASKWGGPARQHKYTGFGTVAAASVGLGLAVFAGKKIYCEPTVRAQARGHSATASSSGSDPLPPPQSSLNMYELSFGSVAGVCAGVFVKKGARALAFFLGGIFVLLQYFNAIDITKTNWGTASTRFQRLFYSPAKPGEPSRPPTVASLWTWLVDFLTADFPPRASFIAGMLLGLRIG